MKEWIGFRYSGSITDQVQLQCTITEALAYMKVSNSCEYWLMVLHDGIVETIPVARLLDSFCHNLIQWNIDEYGDARESCTEHLGQWKDYLNGWVPESAYRETHLRFGASSALRIILPHDVRGLVSSLTSSRREVRINCIIGIASRHLQRLSLQKRVEIPRIREFETIFIDTFFPFFAADRYKFWEKMIMALR